MNIIIICEYVFWSFILFLLLSYLKNKNNNRTDNIIVSLIYMIILSGFVTNNKYVFLVIVFELMLRFIILMF